MKHQQWRIWKDGCTLAVDVYEETREWKDFGLKDQVRRCAVSIPSNIAEGSERNSAKELIRFLNISKGSAAELHTQLLIASEVGLNSETLALLMKRVEALLFQIRRFQEQA